MRGLEQGVVAQLAEACRQGALQGVKRRGFLVQCRAQRIGRRQEFVNGDPPAIAGLVAVRTTDGFTEGRCLIGTGQGRQTPGDRCRDQRRVVLWDSA